MKQIVLALTLVVGLWANAQTAQKKAPKPKRPPAPMAAPAQPTPPPADPALQTPPPPPVPPTPPPPPEAGPGQAPAPATGADTTPSGTFMSGFYGLNVGIGVPYLTQVGLNYMHHSNMFSAELGYHGLSGTTKDVSVTLDKTELALRWHPFMGAFYVGAGIGSQSMSGKKKEVINGQNVEAKVKITSGTVTPQVGWQWGVADGGFFFGVDVGLQNPTNVKSTVTTNADLATRATADYQKLEKDTVEQADKLAKRGLPTFTLLRFGYMF